MGRHSLAVGKVTTVAAGKVARKGFTAGTTSSSGASGVDWGTGRDVLQLLEAAVEDVDFEVGVVLLVATWELDALGHWERSTAIAGNGETGAHGVELTAAHQKNRSECKP